MDPQLLLNRPKPTPTITPSITKISSLALVSEQTRKSSEKLKKIFETRTYQKKTQLTVLDRYKKKLDLINKQNEKKFLKKKKSSIKTPEVKKYVSSFFSPGGDILKSLAALSALKAFEKGSKGDWGGALKSGLVTAGLLGLPLMLGGIGMLGTMKKPGGAPTSPAAPGKGKGTPYSQTRAGQSYAGMQAQRNLPKWAQRAAGGSASRFAASNERMIQGTANIGDRSRLLSRRFGFGGVGGMAENIATRGGTSAATKAGGTAARVAGLGVKALLPMVNIGFAAYRFSQGDPVGGALSLLSSIPVLGWAAVGVDIAREFGAFDGTFLGRKDALKKQTKEQKKLVEDKKKKKPSELTFGKTLDRYEKVVNKFSEFSKNFKATMGMTEEEIDRTAAKIEDLGGGSTPISGPGYEFTNEPSFAQYLTGDVNAPASAYDESHGTISNYHDHFAFKDRDTTNRAAAFLQSKGITVTELGVDSGHTAGSAHYEGRAFDVPGAQWGGKPGSPIGEREYRGSAKVRGFMNDFYKQERERTQGNNRPSAPAPRPQPAAPSSQPSQTPRFRGTADQLRALGQTEAARQVEAQLNAVSQDIIHEVVDVLPPPKTNSYLQPFKKVLNVPMPIVNNVQQVGQPSSGSGSGMFMSFPEEEMLNIYYKQVLLNTLQS
jgi:hypothetical protein